MGSFKGTAHSIIYIIHSTCPPGHKLCSIAYKPWTGWIQNGKISTVWVGMHSANASCLACVYVCDLVHSGCGLITFPDAQLDHIPLAINHIRHCPTLCNTKWTVYPQRWFCVFNYCTKLYYFCCSVCYVLYMLLQVSSFLHSKDSQPGPSGEGRSMSPSLSPPIPPSLPPSLFSFSYILLSHSLLWVCVAGSCTSA